MEAYEEKSYDTAYYHGSVGLRECKARSNPGIEGVKRLFDPDILSTTRGEERHD